MGMIKLKKLLLENKNVIVGVITTDDEVISHKSAIDHVDLPIKVGNQMNGKAIKNSWRYNKIYKTVYWWENWTKLDGELIVDHLKHKYNLEVINQQLIDVPDQETYVDRYSKAHGVKESPIDTFQTIGDFSKGSSFTNKADRALVTHPVAVQKVKDFFKNTSANFDLYFVNTKYARKFTELGEVKESFIFDELKITADQLKDGKINNNNITVFFTNNKGAERAPLTPWIMGHRFGHVIRNIYAWKDTLNPWVEKTLDNILKQYGVNKSGRYEDYNYYGNERNRINKKRDYDVAMRHLCETIGTFKSARDKNLRNHYEFFYELFTQYLKDGSIKFNPLPDYLIKGHAAYGRKEYGRLLNRQEVDDLLEDLRRDYEYYAEDVLGDCIGKIFVM